MAENEELLAAWSQRSISETEAWAKVVPGPSVAAIAAQISRVPQPFLDDRISVRALAGDILGPQELRAFEFEADPRVRRGAAIALWLIVSEDVVAPFVPPLAGGSLAVAVDALALRLAAVTDTEQWLADDERRIEAARTFLLWSGFLPAGEDAQTAWAMFDACDSLARNKALTAAFEGHRHRAAIARQLAEARQREAAARYSNE